MKFTLSSDTPSIQGSAPPKTTTPTSAPKEISTLAQNHQNVLQALEGDILFSLVKIAVKFGPRNTELLQHQQEDSGFEIKHSEAMQTQIRECLHIITRFTAYYSVLKKIIPRLSRVHVLFEGSASELTTEMSETYNTFRETVTVRAEMKRKHDNAPIKLCLGRVRRFSLLSTWQITSIHTILASVLIEQIRLISNSTAAAHSAPRYTTALVIAKKQIG